MSSINWSLLGPPVDVGAHFQQGMKMGAEMVRKRRTENALKAYMSNPDDVHAMNALALEDPDMAFKFAKTRAETAKAQREAEGVAAQQRIGQQFAGGDQAGAVNNAIAAGEFDLAGKLQSLGPEKGKKAADMLKMAGPLAFRMRQMKDPAERQAFWTQSRVILEQQGADPAALDSIDVTNDVQLDGYITASQQVGDLIQQGRVFWQPEGENGSIALDYQGRPVGKDNPYAGGGGGPSPRSTADPLAPQSTEMPAPSPGLPTGAPQPGVVRKPAYAQQTSGYRDPAKNAAVGGVPNSYHTRRAPNGEPLGRDYVPTGGKSMAQLFVDLQAANPHLEVINEGDHVHVEPRSGGQRQAAAGGGKKSMEQYAQEAIAAGADPAQVRAMMSKMSGAR